MREIKFRGKRKDTNEWVYGYLAEDDNGNPIIIHKSINASFYEVIPETVGQYTGVKDKNKKEVYKGDIIEIRDLFGTPQTIVVVEWNDYGYFGVTEKGRGMIDYLAGLKTNCVNFVVIGNIYENPELLEEG